jgi:hypothetical protein
MTMHHSRDSAHKQWSETRVLALRGMLRLLRTCTKILLCEQWFHEIWIDSILVCDQAILVADYELEVSIAGVEVFFGMLTVITDFSNDEILAENVGATATSTATSSVPVPGAFSSSVSASSSSSSSSSSSGKGSKPSGGGGGGGGVNTLDHYSKAIEQIERNKSKLWNITFGAVQQCALHCYTNIELAIVMCKKLLKLYSMNKDKEFRYNENIRIFLNILVSVSRPLVHPSSLSGAAGTAVGAVGAGEKAAVSMGRANNEEWTKRGQASELRRLILSLFTVLKINDVNSLELYFIALSELVFGCQIVSIVALPSQSLASNGSSAFNDDSTSSASASASVSQKGNGGGGGGGGGGHSSHGVPSSLMIGSNNSNMMNERFFNQEILTFSIVTVDLREELSKLIMKLLSSPSATASAASSAASSLLKDSTSSKSVVAEDSDHEVVQAGKEIIPISNISSNLLQPSYYSYYQVLMITIKRYFYDLCVSPILRKMMGISFPSSYTSAAAAGGGGGGGSKEHLIKFYYLLLKENKYFISSLSFSQQSYFNILLENYWNNYDSNNHESGSSSNSGLTSKEKGRKQLIRETSENDFKSPLKKALVASSSLLGGMSRSPRPQEGELSAAEGDGGGGGDADEGRKQREEEETDHLELLEKLISLQYPHLLLPLNKKDSNNRSTTIATSIATATVEENYLPLSAATSLELKELDLQKNSNLWVNFFSFSENNIVFDGIRKLFSSSIPLEGYYASQQQHLLNAQIADCYEIVLIIIMCHLSPWKLSNLYCNKPTSTSSLEFSSSIGSGKTLSTKSNPGGGGPPNATQSLPMRNHFHDLFDVISILSQSSRLEQFIVFVFFLLSFLSFHSFHSSFFPSLFALLSSSVFLFQPFLFHCCCSFVFLLVSFILFLSL